MRQGTFEGHAPDGRAAGEVHAPEASSAVGRDVRRCLQQVRACGPGG